MVEVVQMIMTVMMMIEVVVVVVHPISEKEVLHYPIECL